MHNINEPSGGYRLGGYREFAVPALLRDVAEVAWTYAALPGLDASPPVHRVLPETGVSVCWAAHHDGSGALDDPALVVMGPIRTVRQFAPDRGLYLGGVRLKPECVRWLLGIDPSEHADVIDDDPRVVVRRLPFLRDRLARTLTVGDALNVLYGAIEQQRDRAPTRRSYLALVTLLDEIRRQPAAPIDLAERAIGLQSSERQLRRLVRQWTGSGAKYFQRVRRLLHAVSLADTSAVPRWVHIAITAGYYDQAHLINEFESLAGLSPQRLHAERAAQWHDPHA